MPFLKDWVLASVWDERVYRFDGFTGVGSWGHWKSGVVKPSSQPIVVSRPKGTNPGIFVYIGTVDGKVMELEFDSGKALNAYTIPPFLKLGAEPQPVWGVTYADEVIYAIRGERVHAVSLVNGPLWKYDLGGQAWFGPLIVDGLIYATSYDDKFYALNVDGSVAWISDIDDFTLSDPVVSNNVLLLPAYDHLYALNPKTGALIWKVPGYFLHRVAVGNGVAYATQGVWAPEKATLHAIEITTGKTLWTSEIPWTTTPTDAAYRDGELYLSVGHSGPDARLHAFSAEDGSLRWTSPIAVGNFADHVSIAAIGDTNVFVTSQDGYIYAFARSDGWFAWKAKFGKETWPIDPTWVEDFIESKRGVVAPRPYASRLLQRQRMLERSRKKSPRRQH